MCPLFGGSTVFICMVYLWRHVVLQYLDIYVVLKLFIDRVAHRSTYQMDVLYYNYTVRYQDSSKQDSCEDQYVVALYIVSVPACICVSLDYFLL